VLVADARPVVAQQKVVARAGATGDNVDLAYAEAEFWDRSGSRASKATWSVKAQKKTAYQVNKRQDQRNRQMMAQMGAFEDD